jgi:DNA polymerase
MLRAKADGYPQILHVHDEQVAEVVEGFFELQDFLNLMQEPLDWAPDLPLKAAGYVARRYRKD